MRGTDAQNPLATPERFSYPHAAQSEIVRAHQKDVYYRDQFYAQLKEVASDVLGSRRSHVYGELLSLVASVAYFGLSTLGGAQSLGEEYVNAVMRYRPTGRIIHAKVCYNTHAKATRCFHYLAHCRTLCAETGIQSIASLPHAQRPANCPAEPARARSCTDCGGSGEAYRSCSSKLV